MLVFQRGYCFGCGFSRVPPFLDAVVIEEIMTVDGHQESSEGSTTKRTPAR